MADESLQVKTVPENEALILELLDGDVVPEDTQRISFAEMMARAFQDRCNALLKSLGGQVRAGNFVLHESYRQAKADLYHAVGKPFGEKIAEEWFFDKRDSFTWTTLRGDL